VGQAATGAQEQLRRRIRDRVRRRRGGSLRLRAEPVTLPRVPEAGLVDRDEARQLERDVQSLHDLHTLEIPTSTPRRLTRPLIAPLRRIARSVLRPMTGHQSTYNGANARAVSALRNQAIRHEQLLMDLRMAVGEHAGALLDIERTARMLEREIDPLTRRRLELDQFELNNSFRGSEESVRERQSRYVDRYRGRSAVVDLGCGRGEFLELLRDAGVDATGIDLDRSMVEHCRRKGLRVERRDALEYLASEADASVDGVFAAQVIEHLPATDLVRLIRQCHRVLMPGGILALESVNPEALITFAEFYIDPTHVRPYHPQAVQWLLEHEGFAEVEVELSVETDPAFLLPPLAAAGVEAPDFDDARERLNALLFGRRAYAVVGRAS
jgi:SAM-dependent methyltransferase